MSKALRPDHIERLRWYRRARRLSFAVMNRAMDSPFKWQTLQRAIEGKPLHEFNFEFIVAWLDKFVPVKPGPAQRDFKMEAAGNGVEEPETVPPSRGRLRGEREGEQ